MAHVLRIMAPLLLTPFVLSAATEAVPQAGGTAAATAAVDAETAAKWLAEVEKNLLKQQWNLAVGGARRLIDHQAPPEILKRAQEIDNGVPRVRALLSGLEIPDELVRLPETAPGQVLIGPANARKPALALDHSNGVAIEVGVLPYIAAKRKSGPVPMSVREASGWVNRTVSENDLGTVTAIDVKAIIASKLAEFETQRSALAARSDVTAMEWYKLGRFAWQNRLDEQAIPALLRATLIDPDLLAHIKESRRPVPPPQPVEQPKPTEIAKPVEPPKAKPVESQAPAEQPKPAEADTPEPAAPAVTSGDTITGTPDEMRALSLAKEGQQLSRQAFAKGNTTARDVLYNQAITSFKESLAIYDKLVKREKNKDKQAQLETALTEVNRQLFWTRKASRPD